MSNPILRASALSMSYGKTQALQGVDLSAGPGEVICLIGPNGAGKTTLLNLLGGLIFPDKGTVTVFGMDRWTMNYEIRTRSAFLPAEPVFGTTRTPYDFLRFVAQIYRMPEPAFLSKLETLAEAMELTPHLKKPLNDLSMGLRKKTGIVGCFLPEARLRTLDEPFAGGIDPLGMEVLYNWFDSARKQGETILFSTQVLDQAEAAADRLVLLQKGRIAAEGPPASLIALAGVDPAAQRPLARAYLALTKGSHE